MTQAQEIVGKQGKFEIRIQTTGNRLSMCSLVKQLPVFRHPARSPGSDKWGVGFTLSESGAAEFRALQ